MCVRELVKGRSGTERRQAGKGRRQIQCRVIVELGVLPVVQAGALEFVLDEGGDSTFSNLIVK